MAIQDTIGYRFVRISLVLVNCLVLIRLISILVKFFPRDGLDGYLSFLAINFLFGIIGAIRENRIYVITTGCITLITFLAGIFTIDKIMNIDPLLIMFLVIAVQSVIFSEMLKEQQSQRLTVEQSTQPDAPNPSVATLVLGQQSRHVMMIDPMLPSTLPKDPPPTYFASNQPPPKYDDAIKLNSCDQSLPVIP